MDSKAEEILSSLNLCTGDIKIFDTVKNKFETHLLLIHKAVFERYKFYTRIQEDESVKQFITLLCTLAQICEHPDSFEAELIRDKNFCGIRNKKLSENLELNMKLTL